MTITWSLLRTILAVFILCGTVRADMDTEVLTSEIEGALELNPPFFIEFTLTTKSTLLKAKIEKSDFENQKEAGVLPDGVRWDPTEWEPREKVQRVSYAELPSGETLYRLHDADSSDSFVEVIYFDGDLVRGIFPKTSIGKIALAGTEYPRVVFPSRMFDIGNAMIWEFVRNAGSDSKTSTYEGGVVEVEVSGQRQVLGEMVVSRSYALTVDAAKGFWPSHLEHVTLMSDSTSDKSIRILNRKVTAEGFVDHGSFWMPQSIAEENRNIAYEYTDERVLPNVLEEGVVGSRHLEVNRVLIDEQDIRNESKVLTEGWNWPAGTKVLDERDGLTYISDQQGVIEEMEVEGPLLSMSEYTREEAMEILARELGEVPPAKPSIWRRGVLVANAVVFFYFAGMVLTKRVMAK